MNQELASCAHTQLREDYLQLLERGMREGASTEREWQAVFQGQKRQIAALIEAGFLIQRGEIWQVDSTRCRRLWRYFGYSCLPGWDAFIAAITDGRLHTLVEMRQEHASAGRRLAHAHWLCAVAVVADTQAGRIYADCRVARRHTPQTPAHSLSHRSS